MGKTPAAVFIAGLLAGVTGSTVLVSASKGGKKIEVRSVCAATAQAPDGGTQVLAESCGIVNKNDGSPPQRWCDRTPDPRMTGLVADALDRVIRAQVEGDEKNARIQTQLADLRVKQAGEAKRARDAKLAARDAGVPVPPGGPP